MDATLVTGRTRGPGLPDQGAGLARQGDRAGWTRKPGRTGGRAPRTGGPGQVDQGPGPAGPADRASWTGGPDPDGMFLKNLILPSRSSIGACLVMRATLVLGATLVFAATFALGAIPEDREAGRLDRSPLSQKLVLSFRCPSPGDLS